MKHIYKLIFIALLFDNICAKSLNTGDKVFRAYCWGCHHQTAMAFGPSFKQIANKRSKQQIMTHIAAPKSDYKKLGYKRSVMPSFATVLSPKELDLIVDFIYKNK